MNYVEQNKESIGTLCQKYNVDQLYAFGSVLTDRFNPKSDIDFLVRFADVEPLAYFDNFMDLKDSLAILLNREIDFVEDQAIKNPVFRKVIDREKVLIYDRENIEVPV